jgi:hypothetical protein
MINRAIISYGVLGDASRLRPIVVIPYDNTRFRILGMASTGAGDTVDETTFGLNNDGASYKFTLILDTN